VFPLVTVKRELSCVPSVSGLLSYCPEAFIVVLRCSATSQENFMYCFAV
jgi:hypothetical protein